MKPTIIKLPSKRDIRNIPDPVPVLKAGIIYSGDNGMRICVHCAGQSAKYTGHDRSGQKVMPIPASETVIWKQMLGKDLACESGCTVYPQPK